jgi:hypothetical protein
MESRENVAFTIRLRFLGGLAMKISTLLIASGRVGPTGRI